MIILPFPTADEAQALVCLCKAIALLVYDRESAKTTTVDMGGISTILSVIKHESSEDALRFEALNLLRLLSNNDQAKDEFMISGGVVSLVTIMKENLDNEMLFQGVCLAFEGMATASPRVVDAFAVKGGLAAIFEGMPRFIDDVSVQLCATGQSVLVFPC